MSNEQTVTMLIGFMNMEFSVFRTESPQLFYDQKIIEIRIPDLVIFVFFLFVLAVASISSLLRIEIRVCMQPNSLHIVMDGSYKQVSQHLFPLSCLV